jgi:hypothetical protein
MSANFALILFGSNRHHSKFGEPPSAHEPSAQSDNRMKSAMNESPPFPAYEVRRLKAVDVVCPGTYDSMVRRSPFNRQLPQTSSHRDRGPRGVHLPSCHCSIIHEIVEGTSRRLLTAVSRCTFIAFAWMIHPMAWTKPGAAVAVITNVYPVTAL